MIYFKSLGKSKLIKPHEPGCRYYEEDLMVNELKSQYDVEETFKALFKAYEWYLTRRQQQENISELSDNEAEPKISAEEEQEKHQKILKGLEDVSKVSVSQPPMKENVLKPSNQNIRFSESDLIDEAKNGNHKRQKLDEDLPVCSLD